MNAASNIGVMFSGVIGQEYDMLKLICPLATEMSRLVGVEVACYCRDNPSARTVLELGGGTGITTLSILLASDQVSISSVDNEPTMQNQARQSLQDWVNSGRIDFCSDDALTALQALDDASVDIVASAYTLHNFEQEYRKQVIEEIFRVLKPKGRFINGDRYALDDAGQHTLITQKEVAGYFAVLTEMGRLDLLQQWVLHVINDESEARIMRESAALIQLTDTGFQGVQLKSRLDVNALVMADKC